MRSEKHTQRTVQVEKGRREQLEVAWLKTAQKGWETVQPEKVLETVRKGWDCPA